MEEIWKDVVGYEGLYQVSNIGRVKSLDMILPYERHNKKATRIRRGKLLTFSKTNSGYLRVIMANNGIHKLILVHRLVAQAFIPNQLNKREVNHINGNKTDNRVENLEWVSSSENKIHAFKNKLYKSEKPIYQIKNGKIINKFESGMDIKRKLGLSPQNIGKVCLGKRKSAYGYQWRYKEKGI